MEQGLLIQTNLPTEDELLAQLRLTIDKSWKYNLSKNDIESWLSNFKGEIHPVEYERQLALILLNNYVFYNINEVRQLCKTIYRDFFHFLFHKLSITNENLNNRYIELLNSISFCYLGNQSESGGLISYLFRQENQLDTKRFITTSQNIPKDVTTVVFIDDATVTGTQFVDYYKRSDFYKKTQVEKYLLTFISTTAAKELIETKIYKVISALNLDERNKCFSNDSFTFIELEDCRNDCKLLAQYYGSKLWPQHPLGFDNGQYAFGFFYNTPDNTMPIFWSDENNWIPIIKRFQKKYKLNSKGIYDEIGRFV